MLAEAFPSISANKTDFPLGHVTACPSLCYMYEWCIQNMAVTAQICVGCGLMLIWDLHNNTEEGNENKSRNIFKLFFFKFLALFLRTYSCLLVNWWLSFSLLSISIVLVQNVIVSTILDLILLINYKYNTSTPCAQFYHPFLSSHLNFRNLSLSVPSLYWR